MKYIEEYLEKELKIKPLGKITFDECANGEEVGYELIISGRSTGIEVWWSEYATFLENKLDKFYENRISPDNAGNGQLG